MPLPLRFGMGCRDYEEMGERSTVCDPDYGEMDHAGSDRIGPKRSGVLLELGFLGSPAIGLEKIPPVLGARLSSERIVGVHNR